MNPLFLFTFRLFSSLFPLHHHLRCARCQSPARSSRRVYFGRLRHTPFLPISLSLSPSTSGFPGSRHPAPFPRLLFFTHSFYIGSLFTIGETIL